MSDQQSNFTPAPRQTNTPTFAATIDALQDENATVVQARYGRFFATGSSKRAPNDPKRYDVAHDLATARALIRLGREILRHHRARQY